MVSEQERLFPLTNQLPPPDIVVIRSRKKADGLIFGDGYTHVIGVSYVASLSLIQKLFDRGYEEVELVVGIDFGEAYLKELKTKEIETVRDLARLVKNGKLKLYFPSKKPEHSKLYILSKPGQCRVIFGAANLTESALCGRQANMVWVFEFHEDHPFLANLKKTYETEIREHCSLFMGDLVKELDERIENNRTEEEVLVAWMNRNPETEEDLETITILADATEKALDPSRNEIPIIALELPKNVRSEKKLLRYFEPINPDRSPDGIRLNGLEWGKYVHENWNVPLMRIDLENQVVRANIAGNVEELTYPPTNAEEVDNALGHIEEYINTVELGVSSNPLLAKQSMFEALLYIIASPFANEMMRTTRERHGIVTRRGPSILYITGPSSNGKTAFCKFALKILTGYLLEPIDGQNNFTKTKVKAIRNLQTVFPIVFDDVPGGKNIEGIVKPYWETQWREDITTPQLIITSNADSLKEWAKTRVKLVHFDVHFIENKKNKDKLSTLLSRDNSLFKWFSYNYIREMDTEDFIHDDQLKLARSVMKSLYHYADRPIPDFFLEQPLEDIHDPGHSDWMRIIQLDKVTLMDNKREAIIEFTKDIEPREIKRYKGHLPQEIKHRRAGNSLIIENPEALYHWIPREQWPSKDGNIIRDDSSRPKSLWSKIFNRQ